MLFVFPARRRCARTLSCTSTDSQAAKPSKFLLFVLFAFSIIPALCSASQTNPVAVSFNATSLQSLRWSGQEFLARGGFQVNTVTFRSKTGAVYAGNMQHSTSVDRPKHTAKLKFDWGVVAVRYDALPDKLVLDIDTTNKSSAIVQSISYDALALKLPRKPLEYDGVTPLLATNLGAPSVVPLSFPGGSVTLCNDDVRRPLLIGFPWALDRPADRAFPLRINTGRDPMYPDSLPAIARPILPGSTDRFTLSLRFSSRHGDSSVASDVMSLFSRLHPFTLQWPDRRPIGSLIIATAAAGWTRNPRGWLLDSHLDVTTLGGVSLFHDRLLSWADRSVAILKKSNSQGMITWDIEGEQFPHPTTYIGDPRLAETLAPEMSGVLDEYFKRFTSAGLRVGVAIRPQTLRTSPRTAPEQVSSADPAAVLIEKIAYARQRWGATLFYIDSNGDQILPLSFDVIKRVAEKFPDVLLLPEHKNIAYYSKTAPYSELRGGNVSTPALVYQVYPDAFSVVNTADGQIDQHYSELEKAVSHGDILMFRGWYDDPANVKIRMIYSKNAGNSAKGTK